jgi:hypothetical protein
MREVGYLSLLVALSACASDASSNLTRTVNGQVLGSDVQQDISAADGQINLGVSEMTVRTRRGRNLADRYDETVSFDGGLVRLQRLTNLTSFSGSTTNVAAIQNIVDSDNYRRQGLTQPVRDLVKVMNRYGNAQYAIVEGAQIRCSVFAEHFWAGNTSWPTSPGDAQIVGNLCYAKGDFRAANIDTLTVSLLQNIQLGKGVNAAAMAPAVQPVATAATPLVRTPPPSTTQTAASPAGPFKAAPVGTRFVVRDGYFQITRVEGYTVTTVNAANQTARWIGGLITARSATSIDTRPLDSFFPLAVGKEATLEETSGNDRWRYTIKVLRNEPYTMKDRSYQTFVIEVRDQSLTPDQGGLDRTRTYWYAPELGGIMRLQSTQAGGPPVRLNNWEVVDVIPPKAS